MKPILTPKQFFKLTLYTFIGVFILVPFLSSCSKPSSKQSTKQNVPKSTREVIQIDYAQQKLTFNLNDDNYIWQLILDSIIPHPARVALAKSELSAEVIAAGRATCAATWQRQNNKKTSDVRGIVLFLDNSRVATLCSSNDEYVYEDAEKVCAVLSRTATRFNAKTGKIVCELDDGKLKARA